MYWTIGDTITIIVRATPTLLTVTIRKTHSTETLLTDQTTLFGARTMSVFDSIQDLASYQHSQPAFLGSTKFLKVRAISRSEMAMPYSSYPMVDVDMATHARLISQSCGWAQSLPRKYTCRSYDLTHNVGFPLISPSNPAQVTDMFDSVYWTCGLPACVDGFGQLSQGMTVVRTFRVAAPVQVLGFWASDTNGLTPIVSSYVPSVHFPNDTSLMNYMTIHNCSAITGETGISCPHYDVLVSVAPPHCPSLHVPYTLFFDWSDLYGASCHAIANSFCISGGIATLRQLNSFMPESVFSVNSFGSAAHNCTRLPTSRALVRSDEDLADYVTHCDGVGGCEFLGLSFNYMYESDILESSIPACSALTSPAFQVGPGGNHSILVSSASPLHVLCSCDTPAIVWAHNMTIHVPEYTPQIWTPKDARISCKLTTYSNASFQECPFYILRENAWPSYIDDESDPKWDEYILALVPDDPVCSLKVKDHYTIVNGVRVSPAYVDVCVSNWTFVDGTPVDVSKRVYRESEAFFDISIHVSSTGICTAKPCLANTTLVSISNFSLETGFRTRGGITGVEVNNLIGTFLRNTSCAVIATADDKKPSWFEVEVTPFEDPTIIKDCSFNFMVYENCTEQYLIVIPLCYREVCNFNLLLNVDANWTVMASKGDIPNVDSSLVVFWFIMLMVVFPLGFLALVMLKFYKKARSAIIYMERKIKEEEHYKRHQIVSWRLSSSSVSS
jgi:hypothetical protein